MRDAEGEAKPGGVTPLTPSPPRNHNSSRPPHTPRIHVAGFQPFTLSDFPGRVAAIVFTKGCNFACPFCHNSELIAPPSFSGVSEAEGPGGEAAFELRLRRVRSSLLERRRQLDGVVITGGEPTLQRGLAPFIEWVKSELGLAVKLDTNGSRPRVLAGLLEARLLDFVAVDIKAPPYKYPLCCGREGVFSRVSETWALVAQSGVKHLFRTTVFPSLLDDTDLQEIRRLVPRGSPHIFQDGDETAPLQTAHLLLKKER